MPPGAPVYSSQPQMFYSGAPVQQPECVFYGPQYGPAYNSLPRMFYSGRPVRPLKSVSSFHIRMDNHKGQQMYQGVSHPRPGPTPLFVPPRGVSMGPPMYSHPMPTQGASTHHHPPPSQGPGRYPYPQGGVGRPQPWSAAITPPSPALVNLTTQSLDDLEETGSSLRPCIGHRQCCSSLYSQCKFRVKMAQTIGAKELQQYPLSRSSSIKVLWQFPDEEIMHIILETSPLSQQFVFLGIIVKEMISKFDIKLSIDFILFKRPSAVASFSCSFESVCNIASKSNLTALTAASKLNHRLQTAQQLSDRFVQESKGLVLLALEQELMLPVVISAVTCLEADSSAPALDQPWPTEATGALVAPTHIWSCQTMYSSASAQIQIYSHVYSSSPQSLPCSVQLPPRLKLLEDYCKAKQPAGVVAASESFLVAASNHGIVIDHPKSSTLQSSFSTPPPGWQGATADPFMKAASNHGIHIELPKSSQPQDPKLIPTDWCSVPGKDNASDVNGESSGSVLFNSEAVTTRPVCASDALNQHELALTTLMQSFMGNGDIEHIDVKSQISETNYGKSVYSRYQSNGDKDHNKDDVKIGVKEQECLKQDTAEGCELGNGDNTFSDESIDVIEDHEFLSGQVELSTHYSQDSEQELDHSSTLKGRKNEDCYDEVDGSETVHSAASVLNALEEKIHGEIVKFDKQIDMKRNQEELDDDEGLGKLTLENVKKELDNKAHGKFYMMDTGEKDKIIKNWMKTMEEASEQQDKLLTSVNEDKVSLGEVAASVVKKAIAKGVLKWVVGQNLTVETNPVIQENVVSSSESDLNEDIIGVTVSTTPDLDEVVLKSTEENNNVVFVKGAMDDRHRRISQDSDITVSNRKVKSELVDTEPVPSTSERSGDDFEKFFFKCKASQHGIVIESPGKKGEVQNQMKESKDNGMKNENDNARNELPFNENLIEIPSGLRLARKRTLSELDSGNTSREGSQSDSLDAFKMKALQRGITIQDSKEGVLDSDAELELLNTSGRVSRGSSNSSERFSRQSSVDTARVRHASTPDPSLTILNPSSQEMKPRRKNGISEGSQIRAEAPEFVPGKELNARTTSFKPKEQIPKKPKIFYIPTPKEEVPNPSVSIQATPNIRHVSSETKRFRKKDCSTETSNCITREVCVNTDESHAKESLGGRTIKTTARYVTKSVNTDVPAKRTVGINVRMKPPAKVAKETMTDALHVQDDASKADVTFLADKVKALQ
ncbi:hypothetical protein MAR_008014, partial [Mya arenaria]